MTANKILEEILNEGNLGQQSKTNNYLNSTKKKLQFKETGLLSNLNGGGTADIVVFKNEDDEMMLTCEQFGGTALTDKEQTQKKDIIQTIESQK